jgi:hypothetical protein
METTQTIDHCILLAPDLDLVNQPKEVTLSFPIADASISAMRAYLSMSPLIHLDKVNFEKQLEVILFGRRQAIVFRKGSAEARQTRLTVACSLPSSFYLHFQFTGHHADN